METTTCDTIQIPMKSFFPRVDKINFSHPLQVQSSACGDMCRLLVVLSELYRFYPGQTSTFGVIA